MIKPSNLDFYHETYSYANQYTTMDLLKFYTDYNLFKSNAGFALNFHKTLSTYLKENHEKETNLKKDLVNLINENSQILVPKDLLNAIHNMLLDEVGCEPFVFIILLSYLEPNIDTFSNELDKPKKILKEIEEIFGLNF
jgi:hypothetical protein